MVGQCIAEWSRATRVSLLERVQVEVCQSRNWLVPVVVVVVVVVDPRPVSLHRAVTIPPGDSTPMSGWLVPVSIRGLWSEPDRSG